MIKLINILKEAKAKNYRDEAYAWQKPDGTFVPIEYSHGSDAFKYVGGDPKADHTVILWKKGWQRIAYSPSLLIIYAHNEFYPPSDTQIEKLIELAKKRDFQKVEWDGGKKNKILWSIHDALQESNGKESATYSWQKPDGDFLPVKASHNIDAYLFHISAEEKKSRNDVFEILWKRGWQRVVPNFADEILYVTNKFALPNDRQKTALLHLAIEKGFDAVKWTDGAGKSKILWSKRDRLEESVSDNLSRTKRLIPLIKLARQYKTFEEFERDYQTKNYHGIYWHLTDNPNFKISPTYAPIDLSSLAWGASERGLMVTTDLGNWFEVFGQKRKYAAQIDLSDLVPNTDYKHTTRGFGHEIYVFRPEKAKVIKVYTVGNALAVSLRDYKKVLPQSLEELKKLYYFAKGMSSTSELTPPS